MGHESLGIVEEVGNNVIDFSIGDYVVATVRRSDDCIKCRNGESDMCLKGNSKERGIKGLHEFMSEYYKEKPEYLIKIPDKHKEVGVLLEPLSIVEKGILQMFEIQRRFVWKPRKALIVGAGIIGLFATLLRTQGLDVYTLATREKDGLK